MNTRWIPVALLIGSFSLAVVFTARQGYLLEKAATAPVDPMTEMIRKNQETLRGIESNNVRLRDLDREILKVTADYHAIYENLRTNK